MRPKATRDAYLTIRLPRARRAAYEAAAKADGRTLTGWVECHLNVAVARARKSVKKHEESRR